MRVLSSTEVATVSGAGKVQEKMSGIFGSFFSDIFNTLTCAADLGYTEQQFTEAGKDLGGRIGASIEGKLSKIADCISKLIK
ncbi:hypothetical protein AAGR22_01105 [Erwinia sp. HDF1-3R]|uniref:hypothetical protein n=1 Tax=Erwinia sp. HDF1-3R TaxID=3141543 RepID=UPI0031F5039F